MSWLICGTHVFSKVEYCKNNKGKYRLLCVRELSNRINLHFNVYF